MGEPGIGLAQQGIGNLKAEGSCARMPYWLSLLADLLAGTDRLDPVFAHGISLDEPAGSADVDVEEVQ
jgi:hypothetical protein